jgi:hypothetical protein
MRNSEVAFCLALAPSCESGAAFFRDG